MPAVCDLLRLVESFYMQRSHTFSGQGAEPSAWEEFNVHLCPLEGDHQDGPLRVMQEEQELTPPKNSTGNNFMHLPLICPLSRGYTT